MYESGILYLIRTAPQGPIVTKITLLLTLQLYPKAKKIYLKSGLFKHPREELFRLFGRFGQWHIHDRIPVLPMEGPAGIDDRPRIGEIPFLLLPGWNGGVQGC